MKKAIKAYSIGDKLYNLERIHSKLISYSNKYPKVNDPKELDFIITTLNALVINLNCFASDLNIEVSNEYRQSINQIIYNLKQHNYSDLTKLFGYSAGCFAKFRRKFKSVIKRYCEIEYQEVCYPILKFELSNKRLPIE